MLVETTIASSDQQKLNFVCKNQRELNEALQEAKEKRILINLDLRKWRQGVYGGREDIRLQRTKLGNILLKGSFTGDIYFHGAETGDINISGAKTGNIYFDNAVTGDINLDSIKANNLDFKAAITGDINLNSAITHDINFRNATTGDIDLKDAKIGDITPVAPITRKTQMFLRQLPLELLSMKEWQSNKKWLGVKTIEQLHKCQTSFCLHGYAEALHYLETGEKVYDKSLYPELKHLFHMFDTQALEYIEKYKTMKISDGGDGNEQKPMDSHRLFFILLDSL